MKASADKRPKVAAKPCKPAQPTSVKTLKPVCDTIEPARPRGTKMLMSRTAGVLLIIVLILGLIDTASVILDGTMYQTPEKALNDNSGQIYGRVTDTKGVGISKAEVSVIGTTYKATTDTDGWYFIGSVPSNTYSVQVDKANYTSIIKKVKVEGQMPRPVNFQLSYGSGVVKGESSLPEDLGNLQPSYAYTAGAVVIGSIAAAIGAILSFRRSYYRFALLCAAIGTVSYGFLIGSVLSLVAMVLIIAARSGFIKEKSPFRAASKVDAKRSTKAPSEDQDVVTLETEDEDTVQRPDVKSLSTRKAEQEIIAGESTPKAPPAEEQIQDAEVKEKLISKGYESEGTASDMDGEPLQRRRRKELRPVGPEVVGNMEQALKETMSSQEETETDIVASVLKKLDLDKPVPSVSPKEVPKKRKPAKDHEERLLCRVCVKPIILEEESIKCKCGRTYHIHCAKSIGECKNCGRRLKV